MAAIYVIGSIVTGILIGMITRNRNRTNIFGLIASFVTLIGCSFLLLIFNGMISWPLAAWEISMFVASIFGTAWNVFLISFITHRLKWK